MLKRWPLPLFACIILYKSKIYHFRTHSLFSKYIVTVASTVKFLFFFLQFQHVLHIVYYPV